MKQGMMSQFELQKFIKNKILKIFLKYHTYELLFQIAMYLLFIYFNFNKFSKTSLKF